VVIRIRVARLIALVALLVQALSTHIPSAVAAHSVSSPIPGATLSAPSPSLSAPTATIASTGTSTSTIPQTTTGTITTTAGASSLSSTTPTVSITVTGVATNTTTRVPMLTPTASITSTASLTPTATFMSTGTHTISSTPTAIITATASVTPTQVAIPNSVTAASVPSTTAGLTTSHVSTNRRLLTHAAQVSAAGNQPFAFLQSPFTQQLYGTISSFSGGIAFAPNGDVWVDGCASSGGSLYRLAHGTTYQQNGSTLHTQTVVSSNAGCGLTNHPDGYLYSNTDAGVAKLDSNTGAPIATLGPPGNVLGIAVDPQTNDVVYVGADCRFTATCTIIRLNPETGASSTFAVLGSSDADFVDGIAFDPTGNYLFLSNRRPSFRLTILDRSGHIVQHVAMTDEPDGISFHSTAPMFVVTNDTDGHMTRFDFPNNDFTQAPTQTDFANGGFRGDQSQVGTDGCIYLTQDGTRYGDGTIGDGTDSIVRLCPGFAPSPGVASPSAGIIPWHPHRTFRLSATLAATVDLADGHVDVSASDMSIPGRGPDLTLGHTWDSLLASSGVTTTTGAGWVDSLTPSMGGVLTATVTYTDATGASWPFRYTGTLTQTSPYTSYTAPPGMPWQLTTTSAGYTLTNILTGATHTFNQQGQWSRDTDSYGNSNTLAPGPLSAGYKGARPPVEKNSGGRSLSFHYDGQNRLDHVYSPLWRGSGGAQGQHVSYGYTSGQLTTVTWGAGTTDALTATFGYSGSLLTSITTPYTQAAHMWTINYNDQGQVTSIVSPPRDGDTSGTPTDATVFFYNTDASGSQVVDGANTTSPLTTTYTVDGQGEPIAVTNGMSESTFYTYDIDHDVLSTTDANNHTTTYAYAYVGPAGPGGVGSVGLITETIKPPRGPNSLAQFGSDPIMILNGYDPTTHDLTSTTTGMGALTVYAYDGHHSVITTTQETVDQQLDGACVTRPEDCPFKVYWRGTVNRYDAYGERVMAVDGRGLGFATNEMNPAPKAVPTFTPDAAQEAQYTTRYTYTPQGDLESENTPPINTTRGSTSTFGPVTTSYQYDGDGNKTGETSANHNTTTHGYDHLGRQVSTTLPSVPLWNNTTVSPTSITQYDGEGDMVRQVDANGDATVDSYDPLGRQISETNAVSGTTRTTYSATEKVAEQAPNGGLTTYGYDPAGRIVLTTDPTGNVTQQSYDPVGNTTAITQGSPSTPLRIETRAYDGWNEVISDTISGPSSTPQTTLTAYDEDGNTADIQQPNGDHTFNTYDMADQLSETSVSPPLGSKDTGSHEQYDHDAAGNVIQSEDFNGNYTQSTYDAANRLVQSINSGPNNATIVTQARFDPDGNTVSQSTITQTVGQAGTVSSAASKVATSYNAADWMSSTTDTPAGQKSLITSYGYDAVGQERRHTILVPGGAGATSVSTTVDAQGRTTSIGDGARATTFGYSPDNVPMTMTLPNTIMENLAYDQADRDIAVTVTGSLSDTYGYGYDALGQTMIITSVVGGNTTSRIVGHTPAGWISSVAGTNPTDGASIAYDQNGNIRTITSTADGTTQTYAYGTIPNEVTSVTSNPPSGGRAQPATTTYGYDNNGDTTGITSTAGITNLAYDSQARLNTIHLPNGTTVAMGYNADGLRNRYTVRKGNTVLVDESFSYEDGVLSQATVVSGTQRYVDSYIYNPGDQPLELVRTVQGQPAHHYWYVLDGRSNVVALTNETGQVVDRYSYDVWGTPTSTTESVPQPFRYAGYWWDSALHWYWVSVRSYDPVLKRWVQPDPSEIGGVRTYVYAGDDPIDTVDPSGLACQGSFNWFGGRVYFPLPDSVCASAAPAVLRNVDSAANAAYAVLIQPDIDTLKDPHATALAKTWAVADLVLNIVPEVKIGKVGVLSYKFVKAVAEGAARSHIPETIIKRALDLLLHGGAAAAHCAACFPAGTLVATTHGQQPIQMLHVGDQVLSENPVSGTVEIEPVQAVIQDPVSPLVAVQLSDGTAITATADHPFWVELGHDGHHGEWVEAGHLWTGMRLRTAQGTDAPVVGVRQHVGQAAVYTLTVAKDHTFFVGSAQILVHNGNCSIIIRALKAKASTLAPDMLISVARASGNGFRIRIVYKGKEFLLRVMASGGGRTNYWRLSRLNGGGSIDATGAFSSERGATHIDFTANSAKEIIDAIIANVARP